MTRIVKRKKELPQPEPIGKGQLLGVKAPPYYNKEYIYIVTSAGDKLVRAALYHSPKVRKHWTTEEFAILMEMGIIRRASESDLPNLEGQLETPEEG